MEFTCILDSFAVQKALFRHNCCGTSECGRNNNAIIRKGAIQVLRNGDEGGGVSDFPEKSVTKV